MVMYNVQIFIRMLTSSSVPFPISPVLGYHGTHCLQLSIKKYFDTMVKFVQGICNLEAAANLNAWSAQGFILIGAPSPTLDRYINFAAKGLASRRPPKSRIPNCDPRPDQGILSGSGWFGNTCKLPLNIL